MSVQIKICGLTRAQDAELAAQLGAWALGFIFYAKSPRVVSPLHVQKVIQALGKTGALYTGVFVNPSLEELQGVVETARLSAIQLHGNESVDFCRSVKKLYPTLPLIKAVRLHETFDPAVADFELLDHATSESWGGTGVAVDAEEAAVRSHGKMILAGGLHLGNVAQAIKLVAPFAVDASSGLEESPGLKSESKMRKFFEAIRGEQ